ncbi:DegT/DnrJ/EryC1/StrS family aminotransferase, partial [candidate division WOR-3 bacterium]|nr:DegT/DnrJ/EryC1/StrS family aminotransferase [candidate division WOR-3 bacterium]
KYAIGVTSGTTAVYLALKALDIGADDEVLTPANTFIATAEAISLTGARPVFIDIDSRTYNISCEKIREFFERKCVWENKGNTLIDLETKKRVRAILPVHLFGQMADMEPIMEIAKKYGLFVVEDAAQAHGALYKTNRYFKKAGSFGNISAFSFYPSKNLGAYGNGGAVVTDDDTLVEKVRMLINHGQNSKYHHDSLGWNYKMNGFQGAILDVKLKYLHGWNEERRKNAKLYNKVLANVKGIGLPEEVDSCKHMYHLYVIRTKIRKEFQDYLKSNGIGTSIHYPIPLHLQKAYEHLGYKKDDFSVAEKCAEEIVSMPMFPELREEEIRYVGEKVKTFFFNL